MWLLLHPKPHGLMAQPKASRKTDSLQRLLKTKLPDKKRVNVMLALINSYIIKEPEKGYQQLKEALTLAKKIDYGNGIAQCYDRLGIYYKHTGEYDLSLEYHLKGLKIYEKLKNERKVAAALGNIGVVYKRIHDYPTAFEYQFKALKLMQKLKEEGMIANTYNNIGLLYLMTKDFPKALKYFDKTLVLDKKTNFELGLGSDYSNIALALYEMGKYNKALPTELKALKIRKKIKHRQGIVVSYKNLGYIYKDLKQYDQSLAYFQKYLELGQELKAQEHIADAYEGIALAYEKQGKYLQALEYQRKFQSQQDSVFNLGKNKQITQMKTRYETEKKEQENRVLKEEAKVKEAELARQQLYNTLIAIALLITLAFIYLGYRLYQQKRKNVQQLQQLNNEVKDQNQALQQKQSEILEQQEEIAVQAEELKVTNEQLVQLDKFKQSLTSMIVHDLKNPLNSIIGLSSGSYTPDFQKSIHQSGKSMLNLVMNILDVQRFEETEIKPDLHPHSLQKIITNACDAVHQALDEKNIQFKNEIAQDSILQVDEALILRVFVNLLSNAIKYTPAQGEIIVFVEDDANTDFQKIAIKDNGIGIPEEFLETIFNKFAQQNPRAQSTGLGLTFCKLVVEAHEGEIGVNSKVDEGSVFWFTLPKSTEINQNKQPQTAKIEPLEKTFVELHDQDVTLLKPIVEEMRQFEIYEVSAIKRTLHKLSQTNPRVEQWCTEVENTLYDWNETKYNQLLHLVDQSS
ncbi:hypothetical protein BKI52_21475 [marine bacterium AO1-C]|nr:hypothetical protein BKI52_21475 [marine bacterium AO1-C]